MSVLYLFGRLQVIGLQKARDTHQCNHIRLWLAPCVSGAGTCRG